MDIHNISMCNSLTISPLNTPKVRSLWSFMDGVLSTLEEERRVVESVIRGDVDQYTMDGTDLALKIPRVLLEQIEQLSHLVRCAKRPF